MQERYQLFSLGITKVSTASWKTLLGQEHTTSIIEQLQHERIGHECGLALVRLRKPLMHFQKKYDNPLWGLHKVCVLIEEQRNRGQDGAGLGVVKFDMEPGQMFVQRTRSAEKDAVSDIFEHVHKDLSDFDSHVSTVELKKRHAFVGEAYLGHLRYGTQSGDGLRRCQPYMYKNKIASKNFLLAGNFNMTNTQDLLERLIEYGLHPTSNSDTQVILERFSYCLDREHTILFNKVGPDSRLGLKNRELAHSISEQIDLIRILRRAAKNWDGGYVFAGLLGNGDIFICRDPSGIRPGFYYLDDEVFAAASECAALCQTFNVMPDKVRPLKPGHIITIKKNGLIEEEPFTKMLPTRECTFERIYFSRSTDPDIYQERKQLGKNLGERILNAIGGDISQTVFTYIPNSSEPAFLGLIEKLEHMLCSQRTKDILEHIKKHGADKHVPGSTCKCHLPIEKLLYKNQRMRTFIHGDQTRNQLVAHLYNVTKGIVQECDTIVAVDDSIVRGTTLRESIIRQLSSLNPKKIIIVSSAPPIKYPDCYGIDMSQIDKFIAFRAAVALLKEQGQIDLLQHVQELCEQQEHLPAKEIQNHVKKIYDNFTLEQLSKKITDLAKPENLDWLGDVEIIYQSIEGLQSAMPNYTGDWYFTGNYPTPGGYKVLNTSYLNWCKGLKVRAY